MMEPPTIVAATYLASADLEIATTILDSRLPTRVSFETTPLADAMT